MNDAKLKLIRERFPAYAFLLNDPEIAALLDEAIDDQGNPMLGDDEFQAKLMNTGWWKTHSEPQRQWETLYNTDRAEYDRQISERHAELQQLAASMGLQVDDQKLWDATETSLRNGLAVGSSEVKQMLGWYSPTGAPAIQPNLRSIANEYMLDLNDGDIGWWSREIASGRQTEQTFRADLTKKAVGKFPSYADEINSGITPDQLFSQQRNTLARELELDPTQIDFIHDPRWASVLGIPDPKTGKSAPMTYAQTIEFARSQPEWSKTTVANGMAADMALQIAQTFGKVGR